MHAPRPLVALLLACASAVPASGGQAPAAQPPPQTFIGRLSDSMCAASHQAKASADALTERQCIHACIKALAKYVLVDPNNQVMPIANQDAMGLPLYAGRPVRLTGERKGDAIYVTRVEAIPAHLHLGHVMTNWRDTPGTRGFLPVAIDEARVAVAARQAHREGPLGPPRLRRQQARARRHEASRGPCPACARSRGRAERARRRIRRQEGGGGRAAASRVRRQGRGCDGQRHDPRVAGIGFTHRGVAVDRSGHHRCAADSRDSRRGRSGQSSPPISSPSRPASPTMSCSRLIRTCPRC